MINFKVKANRSAIACACIALTLAPEASFSATAEANKITFADGRTWFRYGDILSGVDLDADPSAAFTGGIWPGGIVYVQFDTTAGTAVSADKKAQFMQTVAQWSADSAVRFIENNGAGNRVIVHDAPGIGCGQSNVGMIGGVQNISLGCWQAATILHETGHALGLNHEQQRSDRNTYVTIEDHNIVSACGSGTYAANYGLVATTNELPYDYASVMHYPSNIPFANAGYTCGGTFAYATITALGGQPAGLPAGSSNVCSNASDCEAIMDAGQLLYEQYPLSARDKYGMALRYGYRIAVATEGPAVSTTFAAGNFSSCGTGCQTWLPQHAGTVSVSGTSGSQLVSLLGPTCYGNTCAFDATANATFHAASVSFPAGGGPKVVSRSVSSAANGSSSGYSQSPNGRYVAFDSNATNLAAGNTNNLRSVYVWDTKLGDVAPISVTSNGQFEFGVFPEFNSAGDGVDYSTGTSIVRAYLDGRTPVARLTLSGACGDTVAYARARNNDATAYVDEPFVTDCGGQHGIFLFSTLMDTGAEKRVDIDAWGNPSTGANHVLRIDPYGRYVAFSTPAALTAEITAGNTNDNVFLRDTQANTTSLISVSMNAAGGNGPSQPCAVTPNGKYVLFSSSATNLINLDSNQKWDVFLFDTARQQTILVSQSSTNSSSNGDSYCGDLSDDGRYVTFQSRATNLVAGYTPAAGSSQVYVRDVRSGLTGIVSMNGATIGNATMQPVNGTARFGAGGMNVLFLSNATNLDAFATNPSNTEVFSAQNIFAEIIFRDSFD